MARFRRRPADRSTEDAAESELAASGRISVRRRLPSVQIDWRLLLAALALIGLALFSILLNQGALPRQVVIWWPLAIAALAALWFIGSLARRRAAGLLGSTALFGVSVSLVLASAYQVPLGATLVGVALICIGMGVVVRGLLWRPRFTG